MKRKLLLILSCLFLSIGFITAQTTKITGTVVDDLGEPVIGATVIVKGTTTGTVTDADGAFSINVPRAGATLVFSLIGSKTVETEAKSGMHVVLEQNAQLMDEVVVTALGLSKSEKILGYSATKVNAEEISAAKSGSVMSGLTGRVAGVNISSAGPTGTSQKVLIRGISSLNSNSPLYIVDGVPIDNQRLGGNNAADFGNSANDINAEDVESVTVLKGASATALYGSRASNGVIMITTKRAGQEKLTVSYDGSFTASNVLRVMQTQDLFGQGWGSWDRAENGSWGPRLDGSIHEWGSDKLSTPMTKPYSYVEDNLRDFYQTGLETNNVVTMRAGTDKLAFIASYGNLNSTGILPNDGDKYQRNTISLRGQAKADRINIDLSMNYVRKDIRRTDGMDMELLQHAVDVSFKDQKDYNDERYDTDNYYTWYAQNPYWMIDNFYYTYQDDRVYGKVELGVDLIKGLKAVGRLGGDFTNARRYNRNAKLSYSGGSYSESGGKTEENGYYSDYNYHQDQIDASALLLADYRVGDFSIGGTAGWNLNQRKYSYSGANVEGLATYDWYSLYNTATSATSATYASNRRLIGLLGQAELGYKNLWFLNLSARNDWSSTLPKSDNSFFYGGVNSSLILTEVFPTLKDNKIDFLKVRAAVGQTGNDADVYKTSEYFIPADFANSTQGSSYAYYTKLPLAGVLGLTQYNVKPSTDLKPEMSTEYEFGISGRFFDNRLSVDASYYNKQTKDQIISAALAPEVGYTSETRNIGKIENKGIEIAVNVTPIKTKDWTWEIGGTYTKNNSKVKELWGGLDEYTFTSWRGIEYVLKVGEPLALFRLPAISKVTDESSPYYGYGIVNNNGWLNSSTTEKDYVGSSQPDFTMGFNTLLKYKNFTFTAVADWRKGGYMVSNTSYISHFNGNSTQTVYNERNSYIVPHSVKIVNNQYVENNIPIYADYMSYALGNYSYGAQILREFVIPKDYFKLREVTISYDVPASMLKKTPVSKVKLSFIGRNLLLFTPKANNYVDPEVSNLGNDLTSEFGETTGTSSTRNLGFGINVVF